VHTIQQPGWDHCRLFYDCVAVVRRGSQRGLRLPPGEALSGEVIVDHCSCSDDDCIQAL
jgi:hypothetical protein